MVKVGVKVGGHGRGQGQVSRLGSQGLGKGGVKVGGQGQGAKVGGQSPGRRQGLGSRSEGQGRGHGQGGLKVRGQGLGRIKVRGQSRGRGSRSGMLAHQDNMSVCFIPFAPHFYIVKLGCTGVYIIFLCFNTLKYRLYVLV